MTYSLACDWPKPRHELGAILMLLSGRFRMCAETRHERDTSVIIVVVMPNALCKCHAFMRSLFEELRAC